MKRKLFTLLASSLLILAVACDTKDPEPEPAQGNMFLSTDWSEIGTGLTIPESYTFTAAPAATPAEPVYTATLTGVENRLDHYFAPGAYRFSIYNTPEHITVSGTTASVAQVPSPVDGVDNFIHNSPGWLFTSCREQTITKDAIQLSRATMEQQVRELTIVISFSGDSGKKIERIEGYLSGAASVYDFADGSYGTPANVELQFSRTSMTGWSATVRLLGIADSPSLNGSIHFADDKPSHPLSDVELKTLPLDEYNNDKRTPLTVDAYPLVIP